MPESPESIAGCTQCWPESAEAAWGRTGLMQVASLVDESHLGVSIRGCPQCGQQFLSTFVEDVDWVDGDDPQYCSVMPLFASESVHLRQVEPSEMRDALALLRPERRSLRSDFPKGGPQRIYWGTGPMLW